MFSFFRKDFKNIYFIVGSGRSGTTMLAQILNSHSKVCVPHELQILFEYSHNGKKLYDFFESGEAQHWKANDFIRHIELMCPHNFKKFYNYETFFEKQSYPIINIKKMINDFYYNIAKHYNKSIFIEQTPWYGQRLEIIKELFPNAKIIHILRDGRDVALSFAKTPWWYNDPIQNLQRWSEEITKIEKDLKKYFNAGSFIQVKYEDFVVDSKQKLKDICEFLNIDFEENMLNPDYLIDYREFRKGNISDSISSKEFNQWIKEKKKIVFEDNIYAWKKKPEIFENITDDAKKVLLNFGYGV